MEMGGKHISKQAVAYVSPEVREELEQIVDAVRQTDPRFSISELLGDGINELLPVWRKRFLKPTHGAHSSRQRRAA